MERNEIAIIGVMNEEPFDHRTWSGSSRYFFSALKERGVLVNAVSAQPSRFVETVSKLLSFHPCLKTWKFKYRVNVDHYGKMTKVAKEKIQELSAEHYTIILQVGAWYDLTGMKNKATLSYHDGNIAALMKSPYGFPSVSKHYIERVISYEKRLYKKMDLIFPMSEWLADSFIKDFEVDSKKIYSVGAGVNLPYIGRTEDKDYSNKKILFVGKDFKRKGGEVLLRAFRRVRNEIRDVHLLIIGPDIVIDDENVTVLPSVNKMISSDLKRLITAYEEASIFVMPSLYEPFGIVFCEAMAHRLPCIGTKICAMPEIIEDGETGFVVLPNNEMELANVMIKLLKDKDLCKTMGEKGYERYKSRFTWDAVAERIMMVIENKL